jgi:L-lactate permease
MDAQNSHDNGSQGRGDNDHARFGARSRQPVLASWTFAPAVAGTWILVAWIVITLMLRVRLTVIADVFRTTFTQMWGALLVLLVYLILIALPYCGVLPAAVRP